MKTSTKRWISLTLALVLWVAFPPQEVIAAQGSDIKAAMAETAQYIGETVKTPQVNSIGGEWAVLGLARSGYAMPDSYYHDYYATVESYVRACNGVLHDKKYTDYARVILALTAIGKDPSNVAGYNLLTPLGDFERTIWQGINGPAYALIALDSGGYAMPQNPAAQTQATRELYVEEILRRQLNDGGFSLTGGTTTESKSQPADPDVTAMVLQALVNYQDRNDVQATIEKALTCLSDLQREEGGFSSYGIVNAESAAQVIVALCTLGVPLEDARFIKNGKTVADALLSFYQQGGGFRHTANSTSANLMATEQGFYALVSLMRMEEGKSPLYAMEDALQIPDREDGGSKLGDGLPGKAPAVQAMPVVLAGKTFDDIAKHQNQAAIEALASRRIVSGKTETSFDPDATMTRAEFCAIIVNALGLTPKREAIFADVPQGSWYEGYVTTAYHYGIVTGVSATTFHPMGTITKQEAAVMIMRGAELAGMDTNRTVAEIRGTLSQFTDYTTSADWARNGLAFCYEMDFFEQAEIEISPLHPITRGYMAQALYHMLGTVRLL